MKRSSTAAALASLVLASPVLAEAAAAAPTATAAAGACGQACWDKLNECRGKPVANLSLCGSNYASCLGYNPFANNGRPGGPVPCSKVPTTTVVASADCACAQRCSAKHNACRGSPSANHAACTSEYATCLGYNPFHSDGSLVPPSACSRGPRPSATSVPGEECGKACWDKFNACRGRSGANLSTCTSDYHACLGHSNSGKHDKPARCSHGKPAPTTAPSAGRTPATTSSPGAGRTPATASSPGAGRTPASTSAPGAGRTPATASSPGTGRTSASTSAPGAGRTPGPDACGKDCWDKYNACRGKPGANISTCRSDYATCIGHNPFADGRKPDGPLPCRKAQGGHKGIPPVVTGHGDRVQPAMAVLAFAAAAML